MQVNGVSGMQYMHAQGGGNKGMGAVMQSLSTDQRKEISSMLQSLPQEDRKNVVDQIKQLDVNNLSQDELYNSIMDILNPQTQALESENTINFYA